MRHNQKGQKAWVGIALVIFGAYFLLRNLDMLPLFIPYYLFGWEMILVVIGGSMLLTGRKEGLIFLGIGTFFLLPEILYIPRFYIRDWWPLILIVIGIVILLRRRDQANRELGDSNDDYIDETSIFGGSEKSFSSQNFKGGKVTAILGGSDIDLSQAKLPTGGAMLDIFCIFGGSNLIVPNDWMVVNESFVLFGGFADKRRHTSIQEADNQQILRIKGIVIFGGAEIKGA